MCEGTFVNKGNIKKHYANTSCRGMAARKDQRKKVLEMAKKNNKKRFLCPTCKDVSYSDVSGLRKHRLRKHAASSSQAPLLTPQTQNVPINVVANTNATATKTNTEKLQMALRNARKRNAILARRYALQKKVARERNIALARKVAQLEKQQADSLANETTVLLSQQDADEISAKNCRHAEMPSNETLPPGTDYQVPIVKATPEDMENCNDFYMNKIVKTGMNAFGIVKVRSVFVVALPL